MKKITVAIVLILVCVAAFAKHHKSRKKNDSNGQIISVESFFGGCYGRCPIFKVSLRNDGTVTYTGICFVQDSGVYEKSIGATAAQKILARFIDYRIDTCRDLYRSRAEDLASVSFTIIYRDSTKAIRNAQLGPMGLRMLMNSVDSLNTSKTDNAWRKVTSMKK